MSTFACTVPSMPEIVVDDADDPRLSDYVGLSDPDLRRRIEPDGGFFVAESPHVVEALLRSRRNVRSVLVTPTQRDALATALAGVDVPVYVARPDVLRQVVGFDLHRGAVAAGDRWPLPAVGSVLAGARSVAVVERMTDHENLGGVFRNAAAFGIDAVLLDTETADPLYRRCVRVSIGHVLTVPWTRLTSLDELRAYGFTLVAFTPTADESIRDVAFPDRCALLFGSEGPGLSDRWLSEADRHVRIPMQPGVDSLNVAAAAAVAFYAATTPPRL
jgi:tRNA G18 (ribose-2'-O)-methylase SpoU